MKVCYFLNQQTAGPGTYYHSLMLSEHDYSYDIYLKAASSIGNLKTCQPVMMKTLTDF